MWDWICGVFDYLLMEQIGIFLLILLFVIPYVLLTIAYKVKENVEDWMLNRRIGREVDRILHPHTKGLRSPPNDERDERDERRTENERTAW